MASYNVENTVTGSVVSTQDVKACDGDGILIRFILVIVY